MARFPPAQRSPRYEILSIGRALDDLAPRDLGMRARDLWAPLLFSLAALLVVLAFVGWLLVGQPTKL